MAEHRNVETLKRGYEAFAQGDMAGAMKDWTDDIVFHVAIPGDLRGDYKGPEEVMGFFGKLMEETGGSFKLELAHMTADDEYAFALLDTSAERNGKRNTQKNVHVWRMTPEGKAAEFWGYSEDAEQIVDFWS